MSDVLTSLDFTMDKKLTPESDPISGDLFTSNYKIGPILKTLTFRALDINDANAKFARFINAIKGNEIQKVVPLGRVTKFACDIDEEIERIKKKSETKSLY